jgi:hypothetical protein|tara:strand:+ start:519 stop:1112 length:594 start_codon:yes stop_codon:yes gene_type:complete
MPYKDKKIDSSDIMSIEEYVKDRKTLRQNLVSIKKYRRVSLGPYATFYFENFFTMRAQIQEMLYIEKGGDEQLKDELEAYNPLIPQGNEIVATFMFEIDSPITRKNVLTQLGGVENQVYISVNDEKVYATPEDDTERTDAYGKTSSVHFLHFNMNMDQVKNFKNNNIQVELGTDHQKYLHKTVMLPETRLSLIKDFD